MGDDLQIIETERLDPLQKTSVYNLWNTQYPAQLVFSESSEFDFYLMALKEQKHYLLSYGDSLCGWAFSFAREQEKWFAIIIQEVFQGLGHGARLLNLLKQNEHQLNGWVIDHFNDKKCNGEIYRSPLEFYLKNNFTVVKDNRLETEKISAVKIIWQK